MELCKDILAELLEREKIEVTFPDFKEDISKIFESKCYNALMQIKEILQDDSLSDEDCFLKIESIVSTFEQLGSKISYRHDF